ncbi:hypothetical protein Lsha_1426 [Legionella shakespearei DSM 23087]|uniref:Uncharacterized protein n=1 Tax=Legionella shakespearei DSM 23087 TaxID=1122169 RepID=A0A0W0YUZ5_9GAMM|nr:hypothetical protein Lsha_1426 [Legionella shakespearei DSM 23087]
MVVGVSNPETTQCVARSACSRDRSGNELIPYYGYKIRVAPCQIKEMLRAKKRAQDDVDRGMVKIL